MSDRPKSPSPVRKVKKKLVKRKKTKRAPSNTIDGQFVDIYIDSVSGKNIKVLIDSSTTVTSICSEVASKLNIISMADKRKYGLFEFSKGKAHKLFGPEKISGVLAAPEGRPTLVYKQRTSGTFSPSTFSTVGEVVEKKKKKVPPVRQYEPKIDEKKKSKDKDKKKKTKKDKDVCDDVQEIVSIADKLEDISILKSLEMMESRPQPPRPRNQRPKSVYVNSSRKIRRRSTSSPHILSSVDLISSAGLDSVGSDEVGKGILSPKDSPRLPFIEEEKPKTGAAFCHDLSKVAFRMHGSACSVCERSVQSVTKNSLRCKYCGLVVHQKCWKSLKMTCSQQHILQLSPNYILTAKEVLTLRELASLNLRVLDVSYPFYGYKKMIKIEKGQKLPPFVFFTVNCAGNEEMRSMDTKLKVKEGATDFNTPQFITFAEEVLEFKVYDLTGVFIVNLYYMDYGNLLGQVNIHISDFITLDKKERTDAFPFEVQEKEDEAEKQKPNHPKMNLTSNCVLRPAGETELIQTYKGLWKYISDLEFLLKLTETTPPSEEACLAMINVTPITFLFSFVDIDIDKTRDSSTLFRSVTWNTEMIRLLMMKIGGSLYGDLLRNVVKDAGRNAEMLEVDAMKIAIGIKKAGEQGSELSSEKLMEKAQVIADQNLDNLRRIYEEFLIEITSEESIDKWPTNVRQLLHHIHTSTMAKFPEVASSVIGGFVFLRFLCPALFAPHAYDLLDHEPSPKERRAFVLVAKCIQNASNNVLFGNKEKYMIPMNDTISDSLPILAEYFAELSNYEEPPEEKVPRAKGSDLFLLHKHIVKHYELLCEKYQEFDYEL